jgi:hypothetical protein
VTNLKEVVTQAIIKAGEDPRDVVCRYQPMPEGGTYSYDAESRLVACMAVDLPTREFDSGYGGDEQEPFIGFGLRYIYITVSYDGATGIKAVPRDTEFVRVPIEMYGG